MSSFLMAHQHN